MTSSIEFYRQLTIEAFTTYSIWAKENAAWLLSKFIQSFKLGYEFVSHLPQKLAILFHNLLIDLKIVLLNLLSSLEIVY